jgi:hypothetical protein
VHDRLREGALRGDRPVIDYPRILLGRRGPHFADRLGQRLAGLQVARRWTSQTPSIHWNGQNRLVGHQLRVAALDAARC